MKSHVTMQPVIIPAQRRPDGSYNIKIRLTYKRRYRLLPTQLTAFAEDVTKSKPPRLRKTCNANLRAMELVSEMFKAIAELNYAAMECMEVEDVARWLERRLHEGSVSFRLDFFKWAEEFISKKKAPGTQRMYRTSVNAFRRYIGRDIDIGEINRKTIDGFIEFLNSENKVLRWKESTAKEKRAVIKKKEGNAVTHYVPRIKAIYIAAQDRFNDYDEGIINIPRDPFRTIKQLPKLAPARNAKSIEEIQALIDAKPQKETERRALDLYLISFALMGMNIADMYEALPLKDSVLIYERAKTRTLRLDRALIKVKVDKRILPLVEKYKDPTGKRLFNFYHGYSSPRTLEERISYGLASYAKSAGLDRFVFYSARHSFATIARNNARIDKATVDECLNHVGSMKMADVYIEKDWSLLWEANKKVLDLFDWPDTFGQDK